MKRNVRLALPPPARRDWMFYGAISFNQPLKVHGRLRRGRARLGRRRRSARAPVTALEATWARRCCCPYASTGPNNPLKQCTSDEHCKEYLDDQTNILEGRGLVGEGASIGLGGRGADLTVNVDGTCVDVCCQITDLLNQKEMMGACDQVRSA